jgi:hypothetical protein
MRQLAAVLADFPRQQRPPTPPSPSSSTGCDVSMPVPDLDEPPHAGRVAPGLLQMPSAVHRGGSGPHRRRVTRVYNVLFGAASGAPVSAGRGIRAGQHRLRRTTPGGHGASRPAARRSRSRSGRGR